MNCGVGTLLSAILAVCAWSADDSEAALILTQGTAWLDAQPHERSLANGMILIETCILEQNRLGEKDPERFDGVLNSLLMAVATDGSSLEEARLVNVCDHLILRYGNDLRRSRAILAVLFNNPNGSVSWTDKRRAEHLDRREPIIVAYWSRINAGASKAPEGGLPFFNIAQPSDDTLNAEERAKAWDLYYQARDVNNEKARQAVLQSHFLNAKDSTIEPMIEWVTHWYLPNDLPRLNAILSAAGFDASEMKKITIPKK